MNCMPGGVIVGDSGLCCVPVACVTSTVRTVLLLPFVDSYSYIINNTCIGYLNMSWPDLPLTGNDDVDDVDDVDDDGDDDDDGWLFVLLDITCTPPSEKR